MKIHLVEDNVDMLESLQALLTLRGFQVKGYLRALDLVDRANDIDPADVVISDYYLPDLNGVELLRRVREVQPKVRALLLTGSREDTIAKSARNVPNCTVLYKPFDLEALERGIRDLRR